MNNFIKHVLKVICIFLTWCLDQGQKIICLLESYRLYKPDKTGDNKLLKEKYKEYKAHLKKFGLRGFKRDFYVFQKYFFETGGDASQIIPSYVTFNYLTPVLNPISYGGFYEDKNMFDKIFPAGNMPETICRRINGVWFDKNYNEINEVEANRRIHTFNKAEKIVIKPSRNSSSGRGIAILKREGGYWYSLTDHETYNEKYIENKWGDNDIIIQEGIEQNDYIKQFCDTAVSTFRIVIYNSPIDRKMHYIWSCIRMGFKGSIVDNMHAGGLMFYIDKEGNLAKEGFDQYGNKYHLFNGIDFSKRTFKIPNYSEIIEFCKGLARYLVPNRFISFDIALNQNNKPNIIEFNLRGYSGWACQFSGEPMFGDKTEEILNYITSKKKEVSKFYYSIS